MNRWAFFKLLNCLWSWIMPKCFLNLKNRVWWLHSLTDRKLELWEDIFSSCRSVSTCIFYVSEGLLQISPVERGVVTLLGVHSGLFVAMNRRGKLYGSVSVYGSVFSSPTCSVVFCNRYFVTVLTTTSCVCRLANILDVMNSSNVVSTKLISWWYAGENVCSSILRKWNGYIRVNNKQATAEITPWC